MEDLRMARDKNHNLTKRGNIWYLKVMAGGKRIKKALSPSITKSRELRDEYLEQIRVYGNILRPEPVREVKLFGEVAQQWIKIKERQIKSSTLRDYRGAMNYYILPRFGNVPIDQITYLNIEEFISGLKCTNKRINNIMVPMRSMMKFALKASLIDRNPMDLVDNLKVSKPDISPLSMDEVNRFLDAVEPYYRPFFYVAFFTGMRFGEMAALKWKNVDFRLGVVRVRETRVRNEEGRPKTKGSNRDIKMLAPVIEGFREQRAITMGKSPYVFLNQKGRPLLPNSINYHVWKPALRAAGLKPRSLYQTRHSFATLMLDAGELPGWVQSMMGHESLKMILERYYSYIKNYERDDGQAFMEKVYKPVSKANTAKALSNEKSSDLAPNLPQKRKRKSG
jgi:integrase